MNKLFNLAVGYILLKIIMTGLFIYYLPEIMVFCIQIYINVLKHLFLNLS